MTLRFSIPIEPVGQMRARHSARNGFSRTYKHAKQRQAENSLLALSLPYVPPSPLDVPLELTVDAYLPIPASMPKFRREMALAGEIRPAKKPDADNLIKNVMDVYNGIFWTDDKNIVGIMCRKFYSDKPRWEIEIKPA